MKFKLSDLASIAEVIGAVAIVISLIYVGVQVNDSTRAVRSATTNETTAAISSWYTQIGSNQQASQLMSDAMINPESLTGGELVQFVYLLHGIMLEYQAAYYLVQEGILDEQLQQSITITLLGNRDLPGFIYYWEMRSAVFMPGFRAYIEDSITNEDTDTNLQRVYRPREPE